MFGIDWQELLVIVFVAVLVIGPKDLPRAMLLLERACSAGVVICLRCTSDTRPCGSRKVFGLGRPNGP